MSTNDHNGCWIETHVSNTSERLYGGKGAQNKGAQNNGAHNNGAQNNGAQNNGFSIAAAAASIACAALAPVYALSMRSNPASASTTSPSSTNLV